MPAVRRSHTTAYDKRNNELVKAPCGWVIKPPGPYVPLRRSKFAKYNLPMIRANFAGMTHAQRHAHRKMKRHERRAGMTDAQKTAHRARVNHRYANRTTAQRVAHAAKTAAHRQKKKELRHASKVVDVAKDQRRAARHAKKEARKAVRHARKDHAAHSVISSLVHTAHAAVRSAKVATKEVAKAVQHKEHKKAEVKKSKAAVLKAAAILKAKTKDAKKAKHAPRRSSRIAAKKHHH